MMTNALTRTLAAGVAVLVLTAGVAWAQGQSTDGTAVKEEAAGAATEGAAKEEAAGTTSEGTTSEGTTSEGATSTDAKPEKAPESAAPVEPKYVLGDIVLGDENAPITIIEYASFTCPHCASFAINTFPKIKEQYIDTGKAKLILREVYFDKYGLWASMTARCGGAEGFYDMADTFLTTQSTWTRAPDIDSAIHQIGRRAGLSNERLAACLSDRDYAKALLEGYKANAAADDVRATPTFIVNGEKFSGDMPFDDFAKILDSKL